MSHRFLCCAIAAVAFGLTGRALAQSDPSQQQSSNQSTETPNSGKTGGDPVVLSTGNLSLDETDLYIPGRGGLDVTIKRTYRNGSSVETALGRKWDFNWFKRIVVHFAGCNSVPTTMFYYDGETRIDSINENGWLPGVWDMPRGYFSKIRFNDPVGGGFNPPALEVRTSDGTLYTFGVASKSLWIGGCTTSYWLSRVQDRMGNSIEVQYETVGTFPNVYSRPWRIIDTYGRAVTLAYASTSPTAQLVSVTDFAGRAVRYGYDGLARLSTVTTPNVDDTLSQSLGNAFPAGKTTTYQYQNDDTASPQRFNITRIIDPRGFTYLQNEYSAPSGAATEGRVISQIVGGTNDSGVPAGGKYRFIYDIPASTIHHGPTYDDWSFHWIERGRTLLVSPNGNVSLTVFDTVWNDLLTYQFTGRVDPDDPDLSTSSIDDLVTVELNEGEEEALDPDYSMLWSSAPGYTSTLGSDPTAFVTMTLRDFNGLVTEVKGPGSHHRYTYDNDYNIIPIGPFATDTPDRFHHGNLLKSEQFTNDESDPSDPIVVLYAYEPIFNQRRATVDPRGTDPDYVPSNGGTNSPQRYMTKFYFDYQELDWNSTAIQSGLLAGWDIDSDQGFQFGVIGQLVPVMPDDDDQPDLNGDGITTQPHGNVVQRVLPTANVPVDISSQSLAFTSQVRVHKYVYNSFSLLESVTAPEGNQTNYAYYPAITPTGGTISPDGGGLLAEAQMPENVVQRIEYDALGRRSREVDGRGFATDFAYNALDQLIHRTDADGNTSTNLYDGNDNVVEVRTSNRRPELNTTTGLPTGAQLDLPEIKDYFKFDLLDHLVEEDRQADAGNRLVTRHRYDKEGNRVLTLSPEFVAGNDASNVRSQTFDERNLVLASASGGLGEVFRDSGYINQAHSLVMTELGSVVVDLPANEMSQTFNEYTLHGDLLVHYDGEGRPWERFYDGFNTPRGSVTPGPLGSSHRLLVSDTLDPAGNPVKTEYYQGGSLLLARTTRYFDEGNRKYQEDRDFFSLGSGVVPVDGALDPADDRVNSRWLFDMNGRVVQSIDDNRNRHYSVYDGLDRLRMVSDHPDVLGTAQFGVLYTYDKNGNIILTEEGERRASDGALVYTRSWSFYDKLDRRVARANNLRHTDRFLYDSRSNLVFESDAVSADLTPLLPSLDTYGEHTGLPNLPINAHGNAKVYEYDDADRALATRRYGAFAGGQIVTLQTYDKNGRLQTQVDDKGNVTDHDYDSMNRRQKTTFGDGTVSEVLDFDRRHLVLQQRDQNGSVTHLQYNDVGSLVQRTIYPGPGVVGVQGEIETYQYDGLGRLTSASDGDSTVTRYYDSLSSVVREDLTHAGLTRTTISKHDGVGNTTDLVYPGGRSVQRIHDAWNRLATVRADGVDLARYSYIGLERVQQKDQYAIGAGSPLTYQLFTYDFVRRTKSVKHVLTAGSVTFDHRELTYNREHDKLSREDELTQVRHEYEYDAVHRMNVSERSVVGQPGHALERLRTYTLDDVGNREQVTTGAQVDNYTMVTADSLVNQYTNTPPGKWFHDENGSLTRIKPPGPVIGQYPGGGTNQYLFSYDYKNQLVDCWNPQSWTSSQYAYDAFGRRIKKTVGGVATRYFYVGWRDCEEQDASGTTLATYVYGRGVDEVLSMQRGGTNYVYHADDLGNVMKITNAATGAVVESYDYDDYGAPLDGATQAALPQGSSIGNPFLFAGRRYDAETRLYYFRYRYLDPRSGRFIARDPIGIWGDAVNVGNGYTYAGSNPWSFIDPMGLKKCKPHKPTQWEKYQQAREEVREAARDAGLLGNTYHHGSAGGSEGDVNDDRTQGNTYHHGSAGGRDGDTNDDRTQGNTYHHGSAGGREGDVNDERTQGNTYHHGSAGGREGDTNDVRTQGNTGHYGSKTYRIYAALQGGKAGPYRGSGDTIPPSISLVGLDLSKFDRRPKGPTTGYDGFFLGHGQKPQSPTPPAPTAPSSPNDRWGDALPFAAFGELLGKMVITGIGRPVAGALDLALGVTGVAALSPDLEFGEISQRMGDAYDDLDGMTTWAEPWDAIDAGWGLIGAVLRR